MAIASSSSRSESDLQSTATATSTSTTATMANTLTLAASSSTVEPLDPAFVQETLSKHPFVTIPGVANVRTLGSYPTRTPNTVTRPNLLFRGAEFSGITEEGKEKVRALGIGKIFDLRSETEIAKYNAPFPNIEGVEFVHTPVFKKEDYSPEVMARRFQLYASGKVEAFMELYTQILDHAGPGFAPVLNHVKEDPSKGCVFYCTAGKDRTGVLAAILLSLAGVDDELIANDYELTRIGREPIREKVMKRLDQEPIFVKDKSAALNMLSSRREVMTEFLRLLRDRYGGAETWAKTHAGFSDEDIATIQRNLVISHEASL